MHNLSFLPQYHRNPQNADVLNKFLQQEYSLVFADVTLRENSGLQLSKRINKLEFSNLEDVEHLRC
mgnify:CR=1 FL=1